jgi:acetyl esterase/lipase
MLRLAIDESRIAVGGDSAGAGLAAAVYQRIKQIGTAIKSAFEAI